MTRLAHVLVTGVSLCLVASGCGVIANYPIDRANDLVDIFGAEFYWGQGILANARGTKIVQAGIGAFDGSIASCDKRAIGVASEVRAEGGLPLYYFTTYDRRADMGNRTFDQRVAAIDELGKVKYNLTDPHDRSFYQVGASVAAFIGVGVNVDLLQTLDFVVGLVGLDIGRDDKRHQGVEEPVHGPRLEEISDLPVTNA
jgi:hypothetical protein